MAECWLSALSCLPWSVDDDIVEHMDRCDAFAVEVERCMLYAPPTQAEVVAECEALARCNGPVRPIPRLVASAVVGLRMKLGRSAMDKDVEGNIHLVRRTATRLLKGYNMREVDAAAHLELIEEAFFGDDTHYFVGRARSRACKKSKFVKWLLGSERVGFDC